MGVVFQIRWVDVKTKGAVTKKGIGKGREQRRKKEPSKVKLFFLRPSGKLKLYNIIISGRKNPKYEVSSTLRLFPVSALPPPTFCFHHVEADIELRLSRLAASVFPH